jgi:carotenoid cleavage dioxygenase-like enzyme
MVSTIQPTTTIRPWAKAFAHPATEFGPTPLRAISGAIPKGLRGSFYRNGPARFDRGGQRVGHWCDGDGAILAVHFTEADLGENIVIQLALFMLLTLKITVRDGF